MIYWDFIVIQWDIHGIYPLGIWFHKWINRYWIHWKLDLLDSPVKWTVNHTSIFQ